VLKSRALGRSAGSFRRCSVVVSGEVLWKSNVALMRRLELGAERAGGFEHRSVVVAGGALWKSNAALGAAAGAWGGKSLRGSPGAPLPVAGVGDGAGSGLALRDD
jgi:hypothetical protein